MNETTLVNSREVGLEVGTHDSYENFRNLRQHHDASLSFKYVSSRTKINLVSYHERKTHVIVFTSTQESSQASAIIIGIIPIRVSEIQHILALRHGESRAVASGNRYVTTSSRAVATDT